MGEHSLRAIYTYKYVHDRVKHPPSISNPSSLSIIYASSTSQPERSRPMIGRSVRFALAAADATHLSTHSVCVMAKYGSRLFNCSYFTSRLHQKRSQRALNPKFLWGGMPPDPLSGRALRALIPARPNEIGLLRA